MVTSRGNHEHSKFLRQYFNNKVNAKEAQEFLDSKILADGKFYFFGFNLYDGQIEIFKSMKESDRERALTPDVVDAVLKEKGLYIYKSPGGWVTIRKVPENADKVLPLRETNEAE